MIFDATQRFSPGAQADEIVRKKRIAESAFYKLFDIIPVLFEDRYRNGLPRLHMYSGLGFRRRRDQEGGIEFMLDVKTNAIPGRLIEPMHFANRFINDAMEKLRTDMNAFSIRKQGYLKGLGPKDTQHEYEAQVWEICGNSKPGPASLSSVPPESALNRR